MSSKSHSKSLDCNHRVAQTRDVENFDYVRESWTSPDSQPVELSHLLLDANERVYRIGMKGMEPKSSVADLPDEILQICFARLPLRHLPRVRMVCKRWLNLGDAQLLRRVRKSLGLTQKCTFVLENEYNVGIYRGLRGRAFDPLSHKIYSIATLLDGPQRLQFAVAGADGLVYILGGRSPLICRTACKAWIVYSRVDVYEPFSNCWSELQPMRRARFSFAAGTLTDPVSRTSMLIVAGGYGLEGEAMSAAEVFDFSQGVWMRIPDMPSISGPCKGEVFEGKFFVQLANSGPDSGYEVYDPSIRWWTSYSPTLSMFTFKTLDKFPATKSITVDI